MKNRFNRLVKGSEGFFFLGDKCEEYKRYCDYGTNGYSSIKCVLFCGDKKEGPPDLPCIRNEPCSIWDLLYNDKVSLTRVEYWRILDLFFSEDKDDFLLAIEILKSKKIQNEQNKT